MFERISFKDENKQTEEVKTKDEIGEIGENEKRIKESEGNNMQNKIFIKTWISLNSLIALYFFWDHSNHILRLN